VLAEIVKKYLLKKDKIRILVAAGGSGGHILPALQVVSAIESSCLISSGRLKIEFICSSKNIDKKILQDSGYIFHPLQSFGIKGLGLKGIFNLLFSIPKSVLTILKILRSYKPDFILGFGGYPSVMPVLVARASGIPAWIHESDKTAGLANKFLSLFVNQISCSFENVHFPFGKNPIHSGHPIRSGIRPFRLELQTYLPKNILVIGGSQASRALDLAIPKALGQLANSEKLLSVRHQARAESIEAVKAEYSKYNIDAEVSSYFEDMLEAYTFADIIISRAGSGAVSELAVLNKPVVFVPLPNVSGHQLQNAEWLSKSGKALIVNEGDNFEICMEDAIGKLLEHDFYREIVEKPMVVKRTDSATFLAQKILSHFLDC
jgi:UDP-N-acetylglucosamine--N-acetylmuramyl-(pentapeptide) pyrophosphoryl-undecaprenol N-acetylglucosamine transferase